MTAMNEARAEATEAAWSAYLSEHGYATVPTSPDTGADFSAGFEAGWDARNAEVAALTAHLRAAQGKLAAIRSIGAHSGTDINAWNKAFDVLDDADTSVRAANPSTTPKETR